MSDALALWLGVGSIQVSLAQIKQQNQLIMALCQGKKFLSDQTSVSIVINESNKFHYPSITFCRKFKVVDDSVFGLEAYNCVLAHQGGVNLAKVLVDEAERQGLESIEHLDLDEIVANIRYGLLG